MNELYAALIQNTSMTMKDILRTSFPQIEYLLEGIQKNNKRTEEESKKSQPKRRLEGSEAIKFLQENKF